MISENQPTRTVALFSSRFSGSILVSNAGAILVSGHKKVYESLNARLVMEKKHMEISALFAAAAAVTALVSALLSLLWFNRIL